MQLITTIPILLSLAGYALAEDKDLLQKVGLKDLTPQQAIEQFPRCLIPCQRDTVSKQQKCGEADVLCLCGGALNLNDPGKTWEKNLKACNDEANKKAKESGGEECDDGDLEIEDLCEGVTGLNSEDKKRKPIEEMFQQMLNGTLKVEGKDDAKTDGEKKEGADDASKGNGTANAAAGGKASFGGLAAMLGFAVALL